MKPAYLKVHNIGLIADGEIKLDKPLVMLCGNPRQGKTTYLNTCMWACGGTYPDGIIRKGESEAFVELGFEENGKPGSIRREWYVAKDGTTKDRPVVFVRAGSAVRGKVVEEIGRLLNPFSRNQRFFIDMKEKDKADYLLQVLGVDTAEIDAEIANSEEAAKTLRSEIKGMGKCEVTPCEKPLDVSALLAERNARIKAANEKRAAVEHENAAEEEVVRNQNRKNEDAALGLRQAAEKHNGNRQQLAEAMQSTKEEIERLEKQLSELREKNNKREKWLAENPAKEIPAMPQPIKLNLKPIPPFADTSELDTKIADAKAAQVRWEQHEKEATSAKLKANKEKELSDVEAQTRKLRNDRLNMLKSANDTSKVTGLGFDDAGNITFEGAPINGIIAESQMMRLSAALESLYPPGLNLSMIDHGESMGKDIFLLIDKAKKDEHTVLVTVVGDKPAATPPEVGVFVVENGNVK